jgi:5-formyltetrahydrofolate cyclo-ligase
MNKHELRTLARAHRLNLSTEETQDLNAGLRSLLFSRIPIHRYSIIHAFLPILKNKEPDTYPILNTLLKDFAADVYISKSLENGELLHFPFEADKTYALNRWGIPEPETTEDGLSSETFFDTFKKEDILVLVPLLAFDSLGNRIGYGKGYYDRFLQYSTPKTLKVGLSLLEAYEPIDDASERDIALDFCITPTRVWKWD